MASHPYVSGLSPHAKWRITTLSVRRFLEALGSTDPHLADLYAVSVDSCRRLLMTQRLGSRVREPVGHSVGRFGRLSAEELATGLREGRFLRAKLRVRCGAHGRV